MQLPPIIDAVLTSPTCLGATQLQPPTCQALQFSLLVGARALFLKTSSRAEHPCKSREGPAILSLLGATDRTRAEGKRRLVEGLATA